MSRPLRIQAAGLAYHVMSRGNNRMPIFVDSLDYTRFLDMYQRDIGRYALDSWLVCVMPNHYHLVFRTREPNLSDTMEHLNGQYARWWNRRHQHVGHVFQARFKAQIIESGQYLLRLVRYVLLNPVRAKLVKEPSEWRWSSYKYLATEMAGDLVDTASLRLAIDPNEHPSTRIDLLDFVAGRLDLEMGRLVRSDARIIGSEAFKSQFARRARAAAREVPSRERHVGDPSLIGFLAAAVERGEGLDGAVRAAFSEEYSVSEIAKAAGISRLSVAKLVNRRNQR